MKQTLKLGDNEAEFDSLSEDEVKTIIGDTLDDRLSKLEIPQSFDADTFKKDILGEVTNLFEKHKTDPVDTDDLVKKVEASMGSILTKALKGIGDGGSKEK